ncbi:predicted protein [Arabidopsis lyrata subsp. lyrata]|uniref:Predicted protein n=1 Tax=Arabidopsis lyrata subsp. lyrata TaxID=81972 RepID=D7LQ86_ARALL|nr:predicted protein [Arabidopsis lyrata subsp. lyrata]EFH51429.1 predicted protein [Arabidopsis lyrata subsp. lyrata]
MEAVKGWIELTNNEMGIIDGSGWTVEHEVCEDQLMKVGSSFKDREKQRIEIVGYFDLNLIMNKGKGRGNRGM